VAVDISCDAPIDAFIEENLHLRSLCDDLFHGLVKERNHLLSRNGGEALEKIINRLPPFEIIDERLHRNPGPSEHWSSTQRFRRRCNDGLLHTGKITPHGQRTQACGSSGT
jgi:hypothetical protein